MHKTIIDGASEFRIEVRVITRADVPDEILIKTHARNGLNSERTDTTVTAMTPAQARETAAALVAAADAAEGKKLDVSTVRPGGITFHTLTTPIAVRLNWDDKEVVTDKIRVVIDEAGVVETSVHDTSTWCYLADESEDRILAALGIETERPREGDFPRIKAE